MAETEKRMAGSYEITQAVCVGDTEIVFGVDPTSKEPYFCALYHAQYELIQVRHRYENCVVSDDYIEIMEQFAAYVREQCQKVREEQAKITVPRTPITEEMCIPHDYGQNLNGKVIALKLTALRPEYRSAENQLVLVDGGSGAHANARGTTCFCKNLYTGKTETWGRYQVLGEIRPECLPAWARERADMIRQEQEQDERSRRRGNDAPER